MNSFAKNSPQIDGVSTQQTPVECDGLHQFNLNLLWGVELDVGSSHWWLISPSQGPKRLESHVKLNGHQAGNQY
jgi:hypothetical protein